MAINSTPTSNPFQTIFSQVFLGIIITATIALAISQIISYRQLQVSFEQFATKQVTVFQRIGQDLLIREDTKMPADYQEFVENYQNEMSDHVLFSFGIGFLLALGAGIVISTQITKPISQLKRTITRVTQSGYKIRAQEKGSLEVKDLITSFNQLISELEEQEELRQELFGNISHELKTPITKIKGQVEGILDGIYELDVKTLSKVLANINQLEYLIQALYEVNRLNPQDISLKLDKCHVKDIVEEAISGFNGKKIDFRVKIDPKLTIQADKHRLRQIIDNLISNAYKFTKNGSITITANRQGLSVTDTGIGIGANDLPHIFERLYRAEKSRSRHTGGLGLGLYIVKKLVEVHGWSVTAKSEVGKGTGIHIKWQSKNSLNFHTTFN